MSKEVDLEKPLSDEDKEYLKSRARGWEVEENERRFQTGKFAEDHEEPFKQDYTVAAPPIEPGSAADNPPQFVGQRPYGVDRAVWGGPTGVTKEEGSETLELVDKEESNGEVAVEDLSDEDLKAELDARQLSTDGDRDELVARLNEALNKE